MKKYYKFKKKLYFKKLLRKHKKLTLITTYPCCDLVRIGHVLEDENYLAISFPKKYVFDFLVKIDCKFEKKSNNIFWITAR